MGTSRKTRPEAQVRIRITKAAFLGAVATLANPVAALAHSGGTDSSGGHNCNVGSCAGTYHYHNGGAASPVPKSSGGSSSGAAALPWDWLPLLALLGFVGWLVYSMMRENDQRRAEVRASRDLQTPPPTPSEKERIDEYFRFKGRPSGDSGPERSQ